MTPAVKRAVVDEMAQNKNLGLKATWAEIARKHGVPVGNLSKWWMQRNRIREIAEKMESMELLGMKAKRVGRLAKHLRLKATGS